MMSNPELKRRIAKLEELAHPMTKDLHLSPVVLHMLPEHVRHIVTSAPLIAELSLELTREGLRRIMDIEDRLSQLELPKR